MKHCILLFSNLLIIFPSISQNKIGISGSYIIAAVGSDGIMVATDTRRIFFDNRDSSKKILAYTNYAQKTFVIGKYSISTTGSGAFNGLLESSIGADFSIWIPENTLLPRVLQLYDTFHKKISSIEEYNRFRSNLLVSSGYYNDSPAICFHQPPSSDYCAFNTYVESAKSDFHLFYSAELNCDSLGKIAEKCIFKYAKDKNLLSIGGQIRVVKVTKNKVVWLQNEPKYEWRTIKDFLSDYKLGKVRIEFTSEENREKLIQLFREEYPDLF